MEWAQALVLALVSGVWSAWESALAWLLAGARVLVAVPPCPPCRMTP